MTDFEIQEKTFVQVNELKKGEYVMIKERPCKILEITKTKPDKLGNSKARISGSDIFTGKREVTDLPTSHDIEIPKVDFSVYILTNVEDNQAKLLSLSGEIREDIEMPDDPEILQRIEELREDPDFEIHVTVLSYNGQSSIINIKI